KYACESLPLLETLPKKWLAEINIQLANIEASSQDSAKSPEDTTGILVPETQELPTQESLGDCNDESVPETQMGEKEPDVEMEMPEVIVVDEIKGNLKGELKELIAQCNELYKTGTPQPFNMQMMTMKAFEIARRAINKGEKQKEMETPQVRTPAPSYANAARAAISQVAVLADEAEKIQATKKILMEGKNPTTHQKCLPATIKSPNDIDNPKLKEKSLLADRIYVKGVHQQMIWQALQNVRVNTSQIANISFISYNIMELAVYGDKTEIIDKLMVLSGEIIQQFDMFKSHHVGSITDMAATNAALKRLAREAYRAKDMAFVMGLQLYLNKKHPEYCCQFELELSDLKETQSGRHYRGYGSN
ncbi:hypothetical protein HK098_008012, partial [Nowakowskiella sp. JEL0407]